MWENLQNLDFDGFSFWIGFLGGFIFLLIITRIRTWQLNRSEGQRVAKKSPRIDPMLADILRLNNDTLQFAQSWHIAASMFAGEIPSSRFAGSTGLLLKICGLLEQISPDGPPHIFLIGRRWSMSVPDRHWLKGPGVYLAITDSPALERALHWPGCDPADSKNTGFQEFEDSILILVRPTALPGRIKTCWSRAASPALFTSPEPVKFGQPCLHCLRTACVLILTAG
jgi:hypothetical protein